MQSVSMARRDRKRLAFLAPVSSNKHFLSAMRESSALKSPRHACPNIPALLSRRAPLLPAVQQLGRIPCKAVMNDNPRREEVPVILLVDHGSKRATANDMLAEVATMLRGKTDLSVYTAHMELASPSIAEGVDRCVNEGATHIKVLPFFLSPGRHATTDIPNLTAAAVANHQGVTYDVCAPIGTHPGIIDVILDRAGLQGSVQN